MADDSKLPGRKVRDGCLLRYESHDGRPWTALTNKEQMRVCAQFNTAERAAMILSIPDKAKRRAYMDWFSRQKAFGPEGYEELAAEIRRQHSASRQADTQTLQLDLASQA